MLGMINQILDIIRFEQGQIAIKKVPVKLDELLLQKVGQFQTDASANGKTVAAMASPGLPSILADEGLLDRVLDNLTGNSMRYTSAKGRVEVIALQNAGQTSVIVKDDGEGMSPEVQKHIFEKHFQAKDADGNPLRRGKGLGLTFCKLAIEAHGGQIWAESKPGCGSQFIFTLPMTDTSTLPVKVEVPANIFNSKTD